VGLWVVATRGGRARKVLGPAREETLQPAVWLSNHELLVQRGGAYDWRPAAARLDWVGDPAPPGWLEPECVRRITSLRNRTP
jgi:hypothetical protein